MAGLFLARDGPTGFAVSMLAPQKRVFNALA